MIEPSAAPPYLRHMKRPDWGLAVLLERDGDRLRYRFEDGETRVFGAQAFALLEAVTPTDREKQLLDKPKRAPAKPRARPVPKPAPSDAGDDTPATSGAADVAPAAAAPARPLTPPQPSSTFDRQVVAFLRMFPAGFADDRFQDEHRGTPGSRKAWQAGAIELCRAQLEGESLRSVLLAARGKGVFARLKKIVLRAKPLFEDTELLALSVLKEGSPEELRFTETLYSMLHGGQGDLPHRFDRLVTSLPPPARTWGFTSLLPALFDPAQHVLVHPRWTARQAEILGHRLTLLARPAGEGYAFALALADEVTKRLEDAGLPPRDRLDVLSFSQRTT